MLPSYFYRTYYETSITLSSRVSKDTHVKHRERKGLKISDGLAFQAVGKVKHARDMTKERIERHLVWNKKQDPSSWISVFNALSKCARSAYGIQSLTCYRPCSTPCRFPLREEPQDRTSCLHCQNQHSRFGSSHGVRPLSYQVEGIH